MYRRDLLRLLGSTLLMSVALGAKAQNVRGVRRIGMLHSDSPVDDASWRLQQAPLLAQLREWGWTEGQNLIIDRRTGGGNVERLQQAADELVRLDVELIVTTGTPPTVAAKKATLRIPIVTVGADPAETAIAAVRHPKEETILQILAGVVAIFAREYSRRDCAR